MPIDSARKRKSIVSVARFFRPKVIVADLTFAQGDRQTIGWSYYGINAATAGTGGGSICFLPLLGVG